MLVKELLLDETVDSVTVNSTCGKHYVSESDRLCMSTLDTSTTQIINGENRGRALILCNKKDTAGWEVQYNDAMLILENQLGLEVFCQNFYIIHLYIHEPLQIVGTDLHQSVYR